MIRELHEELGICAEVLGSDPIAVSMIGPVQRSIWLVGGWTGEIINRAPDEHDQLRWFGLAQLPHIALAHPTDAPTISRVLHR